jgi:putative endonuclease
MAGRRRDFDFGAGKARPQPERVAAFRTGLSAESRAALMLLAKGFRIAARRWKTPFGEIDLVVRRGRTLVFVEVKARASVDEAAFSLTDRQKHRIVAAAHAWLVRHPADGDCNIRFDVMLVAPRRLPRHIPAAFDAGF